MRTKNKFTKRFLPKLLAFMIMLSSVIIPSSLNVEVSAATNTLLNTYGSKYGYSGTCINLYQLRDANQLSILKQQYNSITLENEMKPDAMLGSSARLMTVAQAKAQGYYIPSNYNEAYVPTINFSTVDEVMKICYQNGLKMRAHTLVWHSQTPSWFFRSNYSGGSGFVSTSVMDARLEMYVKTVMNHVYSNQYGSVVYAWDVANEILHANNSGWESVYGNNRKNASYVKKAFNYAYTVLEERKLTNSVSLFYNDYNTYMEVSDVITLVNYINQGKKVCAGVGMQSHLGTNYPSVSYYTQALNSFLQAGFEVQITELDITNKGDSDMASYAYQLFKNINTAKKNGGKITGITWWGLSDQTTWISNSKPLLFSTPGVAKSSYTQVLKAYTDVFGNDTTPSNPTPSNPQPSDPTPTQPTEPSQPTQPSDEQNVNRSTTIQCEDMTLSGSYAGKINSPFSGVALYANSDKASFTQYFGNGTHDFTLTGASNNGKTATVDLYIGGEKKGTFSFTGTSAQTVTLRNISHATGNVKIELQCANDDNTWDAYIDVFNIYQAGQAGSGNQGGNQGGNTQPTQPTEPTQPTQPTEPTQPTTAGLKVDYTINNWGSGYQVSFKISNTGATVNTWTLKVKKSDCKISSSWNVNIKESGDYYVITPVSWNSTIANGGSVEFGVQGTGSIGNSISCSVQ